MTIVADEEPIHCLRTMDLGELSKKRSDSRKFYGYVGPVDGDD
jgi:hypothetical protein